MEHILPDGAEVSERGSLVVGGCDVVELAERFGTPVIVLDRRTIEARALAYSSVVPPERVFYAGKAFLCIAMCELLADLGLGLDVCSGGELATALAAGFPAERILFHGNNKSEGELEAAGAAGVGRIVVDSFDEIDRIRALGIGTTLLVRVTPGVEARTHEAIQTGREDSKFGFTLAEGVALEAVRRARELPGCNLAGLHAHIGSQISEMDGFDLAAKRLAEFAAVASERLGLETLELNLGGGIGIAYTSGEAAPDPRAAARRMHEAVRSAFDAVSLPMPALAIEPGRSIVGPAGVTLYRVGTVKKIPGVRTYVSVDGGMSDNIRPALYGARYEAFLANRVRAPEGPQVAIAGKHCESGDVLIKDVHLPDDTAPGDLVCIPATGAYTYSMASNYNRVPRPAVVMVEEGSAIEIVRREGHDDLINLDRRLDGGDVRRLS